MGAILCQGFDSGLSNIRCTKITDVFFSTVGNLNPCLPPKSVALFRANTEDIGFCGGNFVNGFLQGRRRSSFVLAPASVGPINTNVLVTSFRQAGAIIRDPNDATKCVVTQVPTQDEALAGTALLFIHMLAATAEYNLGVNDIDIIECGRLSDTFRGNGVRFEGVECPKTLTSDIIIPPSQAPSQAPSATCPSDVPSGTEFALQGSCPPPCEALFNVVPEATDGWCLPFQGGLSEGDRLDLEITVHDVVGNGFCLNAFDILLGGRQARVSCEVVTPSCPAVLTGVPQGIIALANVSVPGTICNPIC